MLYLSHSRLEIARKCIRQYKYQYIDELPKTDEDTSASDFGSCIHEIIERYTGGGKKELLERYKSLVPTKYNLTPFYKKKIPLALKNIHTFYNNVLKKYPNAQKEQEIKLNYNKDIFLTGKIDLLIEDAGRYIVGDYKTKKTFKFYKPEEQMAMYVLLLGLKHGIQAKDVDCQMIYLALEGTDKYGNIILNEGYNNIVKPCKVGQKDVDLLKREIETLYIRLKKNEKSGVWLTDPDFFKCKYCPYNKQCEDSAVRID
jgi:RecB family exonuclease